MSREYIAVLLAAMICVLMSTVASGQSTVDDDDDETCESDLPTSEQVANLIRKGMQKVLASNPQQPTLHNGTCSRDSPTSEQVTNLITKVEQVLASNQQQPACTTTPVDPSKSALVSALECEYRFI